eukprot:4086657-Ditylum_brightwellii.AAC.1
MSRGFNAYIERQEECRDFFEDALQPITNQQLAAKGQLYVGQTGLFKEKYLTCKRRPIANKTWNDFKTYWNREFKDFDMLNHISSKEAGFGANVAIASQEQAYSNLEDAMDNLAYAATTSNNVIEELVQNNTKLIEQVNKAINLLKKMQEGNNKLFKIVEIGVTGGRNNDAATPINPNTKNCRGCKKINYEATDVLMESEGYCWSCSYR